jgi:hypothetical protein
MSQKEKVMRIFRVAVYVERIEEGKIYLKTKAFDFEDAQERIENYLSEAEYELELSPEQFIRKEDQYVQYRIKNVLNVEEVQG